VAYQHVDKELPWVLTAALDRIGCASCLEAIVLGCGRLCDPGTVMWEDLPEQYVPRRPRPATFSDSGDMAAYTSGWPIEGRVEPHILGPGLQDARSADERGALLGEDQLLYSFDYPHGDARENAAQNLLERKDITEMQKQLILYSNPVRFFGEP
jgi:hypothetical protein